MKLLKFKGKGLRRDYISIAETRKRNRRGVLLGRYVCVYMYVYVYVYSACDVGVGCSS